jgi:hypothetical protein
VTKFIEEGFEGTVCIQSEGADGVIFDVFMTSVALGKVDNAQMLMQECTELMLKYRVSKITVEIDHITIKREEKELLV